MKMLLPGKFRFGAVLSLLMIHPCLSKDGPGLYSQIEGNWINYRGDQYEIMRISKDEVSNSFFSWNGSPRFARTSDLKLKSSGSGKSETAIEKGAEWHYLDGGKAPEDSLWTGLAFDAEKEVGRVARLASATVTMMTRQLLRICRTTICQSSYEESSRFQRVQT